MGAYVNPRGERKEEFLNREGVPCSSNLKWEDIPNDCLAVCLIDNGMFTAAGIAFSAQELEAFKQDTTTRPTVWFVVETKKLLQVSKELTTYRPDLA